jgi:hypothetical protein
MAGPKDPKDPGLHAHLGLGRQLDLARTRVGDLLDSMAEQVAALPEEVLRPLLPVLAQAERELEAGLRAWISQVPDGDKRFTAQEYRRALTQIKRSLDTVETARPALYQGLLGGSRDAGLLALAHVREEWVRFSLMFDETIRPIALEEASILARGKKALVPRFRTSAARYSRDVQDHIRRELAAGVVKGETIDQLVRRLVRNHGGPKGHVALRGVAGEPGALVEYIPQGLFRKYRHWADRLARTEVMNAYNVHADESIAELAEDDAGVLRKWDASLDFRACEICRGLDEQSVAVGEPFSSGILGRVDHPPAHPYCRCVLVAWHEDWDGKRPRPPEKKPRKPPKTHVGPEDLPAEKLKGLHGTAFSTDAHGIENHDVQVRRVRDQEGAEWHEFGFKVTMGQEKQAMEALRGAMKTPWRYPERKLVNGILTDQGPGQQVGQALSLAFGGEGEIPAYRMLFGTTGAIRNLVRLRVAGSTAEALRGFEHALKQLGIADPLRLPKPGDRKAMAMAKVATRWAPEKMVPLLSREMKTKTIQPVFEEVAKHYPVTRDIVKDAKAKEVYPGHRALYSKAQAKYFKDGGVIGLYHDSRADDDVVVNIVTKNGIMSSSSRFDRGIFVTGMSTTEDFRTGGADGAFTRLARERRQLESRPYGKVRFVIRADELGRMDWWAFNADRYGAAGPNQMAERWTAPRMVTGDIAGSNEVIFQKGIPVSGIEKVVVGSEEHRKRLIRKIRKEGVRKINGKKIEDFIVVGGT